MSRYPNWSATEEEYLAENWGRTSIPSLSKHLGRSQNAVIVRAQRMGLGAFLESGDYVTYNQLLLAVTRTTAGSGYKLKSWVEKRGLPIHYKRVGKNRWRVVYLDEFWAWAEKNKAFIDWTKMERYALGEEPAWVEEQRRHCANSFANQRKDPWTGFEDSRLKALLKLHRYGYAELSKELQRSVGAIQRRIQDLGLKERPIRADNHNPWMAAEFQILADGIREGRGYSEIADQVGRSEKAVRGRVFQVYKTENLDKVRAMLGAGPWGTGAPTPTAWQDRFHKGTRRLVSQLAGLLAYHRNELGYEPYWQRHMCQHWNPVKGCTAGEENCDTCTSFQRIRPQYCKRCGGEFLERQVHDFCSRCRAARKKQAQKKYAVLQARSRL
ncbi:hypothetical protein [Pseudoflavonifractor capillosus]|uniref:hypothetical protein n=1 Tax=Pseudoflavonifractor capillosus TaxID=106588 RepID=UPI001957F206|nr:hypothetical protein [Pseudoflavonifractor capillosus]MBM6680067.1 hypothetical protein [Pseudoflavonifractor capillosus]